MNYPCFKITIKYSLNSFESPYFVYCSWKEHSASAEPVSHCLSPIFPDHTSLIFLSLDVSCSPHYCPSCHSMSDHSLKSLFHQLQLYLLLFSTSRHIHKLYILTVLFSTAQIHTSSLLLYCQLLAGRGNFFYSSSLLLNNVHCSK